MKDKLTAYGMVSIVSYIVRNAILPNPFDGVVECAALVNIVAEPIIHLLAFLVTGLFYEKKSLPWWGSLLYLFFYSAIVLALWLLSLVNFVWWSIVVAIVIVAGLGVGVFTLSMSKEGYD